MYIERDKHVKISKVFKLVSGKGIFLINGNWLENNSSFELSSKASFQPQGCGLTQYRSTSLVSSQFVLDSFASENTIM